MAPRAVERLRAGTVVATGGLFAYYVARFRSYLVDDAFISLRYARHLAEGEGLVYNLGDRVEGYTNFLWVLLGALGTWLKTDPILLLRAGSLVAALGLFFVVAKVSKLSNGEPGVAGPPAIAWLLPLPAVGYWACSTMESMAFTALFVAGIWLRLLEGEDGRWRGSAFAFLVLALTRPEGIFCFAMAVAFLGMRERIVSGTWPVVRALRDIAVFAVGFVPFTVWRLIYFGSFFPNTFHAKVTGGIEQWRDGLVNAGDFLVTYPVLAIVAFIVPVVLWRARSDAARLDTDATAFSLWALTVGWVSYVVSIGGDFMPFERFFLPVLPLLAVLTSWALTRSTQSVGPLRRLGVRWTVPAAMLLLLLHTGVSVTQGDFLQAFRLHRMTTVAELVGHHLARTLKPEATIAVNAAGAVAYSSRLRTIDMLGLTDPVIARAPPSGAAELRTGHRRGLGSYVLERGPEAIFWGNAAGDTEPLYGGDRQIAGEPYFRFFYAIRTATLTGEDAFDESRPLEQFASDPLGHGRPGFLTAPDMGLRFEIRKTWLVHTVAHAAPIDVSYFLFRPELERFWPLRDVAGDDLELFLREVATAWQRESPVPKPHEALERELEEVAQTAIEFFRKGDPLSASVLLDVILERSAGLGSAHVHQRASELAFALGDLPTAVESQLQAMRADPYDRSLAIGMEDLLTAPWPSS